MVSGLAATQPPPLDSFPGAAERAWGRHPASAAYADSAASAVTAKLHPPAAAPGAPAEKFDPTFVGSGWGHRKRIPPHPPQYLTERPGKRTYNLPHCFAEVDFLRQGLAVPHGPQMGSVRVVRARRREEKICQDVERKQRDEERAALAATGKERRRAHLTEVGARAGCNPLTGGAPIAGQEVLYAPARPKLRPRLQIEREQAPPADLVDHELAAARAAERRRRLANDGIEPERRNWSVGQQMCCYDGYDCPPEVRKRLDYDPPKPGRRIFRDHAAKNSGDGGAAGALNPHLPLPPLVAAAAPAAAAPPDPQ